MALETAPRRIAISRMSFVSAMRSHARARFLRALPLAGSAPTEIARQLQAAACFRLDSRPAAKQLEQLLTSIEDSARTPRHEPSDNKATTQAMRMSTLKRAVSQLYPFNRLIKQRDACLDEISRLQQTLSLSQQRHADDERHIRQLLRQLHDAQQQTPPGSPSDSPPLKSDIDFLRRELIDYGLASSTSPPRAPDTRRVRIDDDYRRKFTEVLKATFFKTTPPSVMNSSVFAHDMAAHLEVRYQFFADHIVPWVKTVAPNLHELTALELGPGTGSSTLAFAPQVREVVCFEIDDVATDAARQRMKHFGLSNVEHREELFGPDCAYVREGRKADIAVFCAVLEHMTFQELIQCLRAAWQALRPGGLLIVADTPNRFAGFDGHTSLMPLFSALPAEIRQLYSAYSPRDAFVAAIAQAVPEDRDLVLTRWGCGISYHDFELALGRDIHDCIVLDGYEPIICEYLPPQPEDGLLRLTFDLLKIPANRAFTRASLNFVLQKNS